MILLKKINRLFDRLNIPNDDKKLILDMIIKKNIRTWKNIGLYLFNNVKNTLHDFFYIETGKYLLSQKQYDKSYNCFKKVNDKTHVYFFLGYILYNKYCFFVPDNITCMICLDTIKSKTDMYKNKDCEHIFHKHCSESLLSKMKHYDIYHVDEYGNEYKDIVSRPIKCPLCRKQVDTFISILDDKQYQNKKRLKKSQFFFEKSIEHKHYEKQSYFFLYKLFKYDKNKNQEANQMLEKASQHFHMTSITILIELYKKNYKKDKWFYLEILKIKTVIINLLQKSKNYLYYSIMKMSNDELFTFLIMIYQKKNKFMSCFWNNQFFLKHFFLFKQHLITYLNYLFTFSNLEKESEVYDKKYKSNKIIKLIENDRIQYNDNTLQNDIDMISLISKNSIIQSLFTLGTKLEISEIMYFCGLSYLKGLYGVLINKKRALQILYKNYRKNKHLKSLIIYFIETHHYQFDIPSLYRKFILDSLYRKDYVQDKELCYLIGKMYYNGIFFIKNRLKSVMFFKLHKCSKSLVSLSKYQQNKNYIKNNINIATKNDNLVYNLLSKASFMMNRKALFDLAKLLLKENEFHDYKISDIKHLSMVDRTIKSISLLTKSFKLGCVESCYMLGFIYYTKLKCYAKAIEYWTQSANKNHILSMERLYYYYKTNYNYQNSINETVYWCEKIIKLKYNVSVIKTLAHYYYYLYSKYKNSILLSRKRALYLNLRIIESNPYDIESLYILGNLYAYNMIDEINYKKAKMYWYKALQLEQYENTRNCKIRVKLSKLLQKGGHGILKDEKMAFTIIYNSKHKTTNPYIMIELANMYKKGIGIYKNIEKAYSIWTMIIENKNFNNKPYFTANYNIALTDLNKLNKNQILNNQSYNDLKILISKRFYQVILSPYHNHLKPFIYHKIGFMIYEELLMMIENDIKLSQFLDYMLSYLNDNDKSYQSLLLFFLSKGNNHSFNLLGQLYRDGVIFKQSLKESYYWFHKSSRQSFIRNMKLKIEL